MIALLFLAALQAGPVPRSKTDFTNYRSGMAGVAADGYRMQGLGFGVQDAAGPALLMNGGAVVPKGRNVVGHLPFQLGRFTSGGDLAFASQSTTWVSNAQTYGSGAAAVTVTASRLSPAVLVETGASQLHCFGPVASARSEDVTWVQRHLAEKMSWYENWYLWAWNDGRIMAGGTTLPLRWATPGRSGVLGAQTLPPYPFTGLDYAVPRAGGPSTPPLDAPWLLLWWGRDSVFTRSTTPFVHWQNPYASPLQKGTPLWPTSETAYQADIPLLLVFRNAPSSIGWSAAQGVSFGDVGRMAVLPLFGFKTPPAAETEAWLGGLPADVRNACDAWAARLARFPVDVVETVDATADAITHTETVSYVDVKTGGSAFSPLRPMLALARQQGMSVDVTPPPADTGLLTEFGPLQLIPGATHAWTIHGLAAEARKSLELGASTPDSAPLEAELAAEVAKVVAAGHLRPFVYGFRHRPDGAGNGSVYWYDPSEQLHLLAETLPLLPVAPQASLRDYLRSERTSWKPETVVRMRPETGTPREWHATDWYVRQQSWYLPLNPDPAAKDEPRAGSSDFDESDTNVLYRAYGLARYYDALGEAPDAAVMTWADGTLARSLANRQWDTLGWFWGNEYAKLRNHMGHYFTSHTIRCVNRDLAGLIGLVRLHARAGTPTPPAALGQLARLWTLRFAMARYGRALAGLYPLPADAGTAAALQRWGPYPSPDAHVQQVLEVNQHGIVLSTGATQSGETFGAFQVPYLDLSPETARLLREAGLGPDTRRALDRLTLRHANWYRAWADSVDGNEWRYFYPSDSWQYFLAHARIAGTPAVELRRLIDVPWMKQGDLYYLHKLAEAAKAFRGGTWR